MSDGGDKGERDEAGVRRVRVRLGGGCDYSIEVGAGALDRLGRVARASLAPQAARVALVSNRRVFSLYGARAVRSLSRAGFAVEHWLMGDGERFKTLGTAGRALEFLSGAGLERSDAVAALGGGVVGDLAGLAAALYLRGVAFLQIPTTLLAQVDSSVGGKTGVNLRGGKNLAGAFHQPRAVVVDTATLRTLAPRELTAGWCEAIKQGAVGDRRLFELTRDFLAEEKLSGRGRRLMKRRLAGDVKGRGPRAAEASDETAREERLADLIAAQCAFKARVVAGDEREALGRTDARSRRILNFGHTVGHALEAVTGFRRFRHGEAVGYGMIAAAEISEMLGLLDRNELELLRGAVGLAGRLPRADDLEAGSVARALRFDKKRLGGHVQWVLLEGLGRARVVDGKAVPPRVVKRGIRAALSFGAASSDG